MLDIEKPITENPVLETQLSVLFGGYRADWLDQKLFTLFLEPAYFPEMETARPCMLMGGRGTGKTTVLRCLSYEGRHALNPNEAVSVWPYYGLYLRVNTNQMSSMVGQDLSEQKWTPIFAHYINLIVCQMGLRFLVWFNRQVDSPVRLPARTLKHLVTSLHLTQSGSLEELEANLEDAVIEFESGINSISDGPALKLSMQGKPIELLFEALRKLPAFAERKFFLLLDEFENFEVYQQRVINTLIKHAGTHYTFKVGVREMGIKETSTLNPHEQLSSPADYVLVDIASKLNNQTFERFAREVCNRRLATLDGERWPFQDMRELLPSLSEEEEALRLGVLERVEEILRPISEKIAVPLRNLEPMRVILIKFWADTQKLEFSAVWKDYQANPKDWDTRFNNYKHALLFTLRQRKRGLRKYYCGWDTFILISGGNIRYLLELVHQSILFYLREQKEGPEITWRAIDPETQTEVAKYVGERNLREIQRYSVHGREMVLLVQGLGRVFGLRALHPERHSPEVNQFYLRETQLVPRMAAILRDSIMHLALLRTVGTKAIRDEDTKADDYMVHPIFAPFFDYSYRRKRKMKVSEHNLLQLIDEPASGVRALARIEEEIVEQGPSQRSLF